MEYLLILTVLSCILNTILLWKIIGKRNLPEGSDTSLYDEQIKNLKRIIRLNEKHIKQLKEDKKDEADMVQVTEQKRVY